MRKNSNTIHQKDSIPYLNFLLFGFVLFLAFYYIAIANQVATQNYKLETLRDKIGGLAEKNAVLISERVSLETPAKLLEFASSKNFIEAANILHIFESKNVARR